jgi:hypothetical protein
MKTWDQDKLLRGATKGRLSLSGFVTNTADECKQYISPNSYIQDEGQEKEKKGTGLSTQERTCRFSLNTGHSF